MKNLKKFIQKIMLFNMLIFTGLGISSTGPSDTNIIGSIDNKLNHTLKLLYLIKSDFFKFSNALIETSTPIINCIKPMTVVIPKIIINTSSFFYNHTFGCMVSGFVGYLIAKKFFTTLSNSICETKKDDDPKNNNVNDPKKPNCDCNCSKKQ